MISYSLVKSSFCSHIFPLMSLNFLSVFPSSSLSSSRTAIPNTLSAKSQYFIALSPVFELLLYLRDNIFSWCFMLLVFLHCCCLMWSSRHLLKHLLVAFRWGTNHWCCYIWGFLCFLMSKAAPLFLLPHDNILKLLRLLLLLLLFFL